MSEALLLNDIFERNGHKYRLLHIAKALQAAYVIRLDTANPDPRRWALTELTGGTGANKIKAVKNHPKPERPNPESAPDIAIRELRWSRINDIKKSPDVWEAESRTRLLKNHALSIGVTAKTLLANLRLYWTGGQTKEALLGNSYKSGCIEESTPGSLSVTEKSPNGSRTVVFAPAKKNARGRRPKEGGYSPLAMPPALREKILEAARLHFEQDKTKSIRGASTSVLNEMFSLRDEKGQPLRDADGGAVLKPPGQRPSEDQIRYLLGKVLMLSSTHKRRSGAADYENNHKPSTGSVLDDCLGPGDVYEIDATFIDVYIVAKANRKVIIGKPTLYLVGRGSAVWMPLARSGDLSRPGEFEQFLKALWRYQWVQNPVELTPQWTDIFFFHTQGIPDMMVKLFESVQEAAIASKKETLTPELVALVFTKEFVTTAFGITALRDGDKVLLDAVTDLYQPNLVQVARDTQQQFPTPRTSEIRAKAPPKPVAAVVQMPAVATATKPPPKAARPSPVAVSIEVGAESDLRKTLTGAADAPVANVVDLKQPFPV